MKDYKEFQFGWIIFGIVIPVQIIITYVYLNNIGNTSPETNGFIITNLIFMLTYLLFYGMTTKVTVDSIKISFGIGLISKRIHLPRILAVKTVKNPWYYGWGLRLIPKGTLYNISGSDGIEIKFIDTVKVIRIGTKDSIRLKQEIEKRLSLK